MTLTPAYGRDYKSAKDVKTDWNANKDFIIADIVNPYCGKPANKTNLANEGMIYVRYARLTKVVRVQ